MATLGLILARGGSKRCVGKNIRLLGGVPLLAWSIAAGRHSRSVDAIVVSSDDDKILKVAEEYGALALKRPKEMATDKASSYLGMLHALDTLEGNFDALCLLQPTSPFRIPQDIDGCFDAARAKGDPAAVTVEIGKRVPNGAVYVAKSQWLVESLARDTQAPFDGPEPAWHFMPSDRSIDIDTEADFARAQRMLVA